MKRKQIYLDEESESALKDLATARGVSEAALIRQAVHEYFGSISKNGNRENNPLYKLIGLIKDPGPRDYAEQHDHYLYGTPKKSEKKKK